MQLNAENVVIPKGKEEMGIKITPDFKNIGQASQKNRDAHFDILKKC